MGRPVARRSASPGVVSSRIPRQRSSSSSPAGPCGLPSRVSVTGSRVESSRRGGRPASVQSRPLCYRAATHADHSRASPAPSSSAPATAARTGRIDLRSDRRRRPRRRPPYHRARRGHWCGLCRGRLQHYAAGLPDPVEALNNIDFEQQTIIYDRTGKVELARLGDLKRELVTYNELPGEIIDATTAIEDKDFWSNPGFDPAG